MPEPPPTSDNTGQQDRISNSAATHGVRALWHLRHAQEELAKAWGSGPDRLTEAEAIDEAQRSTEFAVVALVKGGFDAG